MVKKNNELFSEFRKVHDEVENNKSLKKDFNKIGEEVIEVIRIYVDDLCRTSEGSGYGNYTSKLSDKFWNEVRKEFPLIDDVGIE